MGEGKETHDNTWGWATEAAVLPGSSRFLAADKTYESAGLELKSSLQDRSFYSFPTILSQGEVGFWTVS